MRVPSDDELDEVALKVRARLERLLIFLIPEDDQAHTSLQHRYRVFDSSVGLTAADAEGSRISGEDWIAPPEDL